LGRKGWRCLAERGEWDAHHGDAHAKESLHLSHLCSQIPWGDTTSYDFDHPKP
jgi:hypothetical protein